jgi:hypothetical protein
MITRERLPLNNNLPPLLTRPIKTRHSKMQIRRQSLHNSNFVPLGPHNLTNIPHNIIINMQPRRQFRILDFLEMSIDAFGRPGLEVVLLVLGCVAWLEAEGVAAEVGAGLWLRLRGGGEGGGVEVGDCWDDELGAEGGERVLFILGFGVGLAEEIYCFLVVLVRHVWISELRVLRGCRRVESSCGFLERF